VLLKFSIRNCCPWCTNKALISFQTFKTINLLYKDENVYVCVSGRRTYKSNTTYHPEIWHGLLISPGLGTKPGGDQKCWPRPRPQARRWPRPLLLLRSGVPNLGDAKG
jgi:hypothetical protein